MTKVAIVTGGNKGIGYAIVRGLCKKFDGDVFLTARDENRGLAAVEGLKKEGLSPKFHQLDLNDKSSIEKMKQFIADKYGGLDLLVNNAGMAYKQSSTAPFSEQAEVTMATNYWGTLNVCNVMFPLLKSGARVVHVSSMVSMFAMKKASAELNKEFAATDSIDAVSQLMTRFVEAAKAGNHEKLGWPNSAYGMTKVGVTLMTPIQQAEIDKDKSRSDIVINCCCPGYVDTDMTSHKGTKTVEEGADTPLYLALLPPGVKEPRGEYLSERKVQKWK